MQGLVYVVFPNSRGQRECGVNSDQEGTRKVYALEFKLQAVEVIADQRLSVAEAALRLRVGGNLFHARKRAAWTSP